MDGSIKGKLKRLELQGPDRDESLWPVVQIIVETYEEAKQSRELDELFRTNRAYLDLDALPPKTGNESFSFAEYLDAIVYVPEDQVLAQPATAATCRRRLFV